MAVVQDRPNDDGLNLKELAEDANLSLEGVKGSKRKKKLIMIIGLFFLLILFISGAYFLLRANQVQVKASNRATAKITSGADMQKAAYDSLKGTLDAPAVGATAINTGPGQSSSPNGNSSPASVQSGIAMTVAPPPEFQGKRSGREFDDNAQMCEPASDGSKAASLNVSVAKPKVGSSITLVSLPTGPVGGTRSDSLIPANSNDSFAAKINEIKPTLRRAGKKSVPSFGAMLPVRLIGVLYTLRSGLLVRLELSRDIKSDGDLLRRGTIFVGALHGGELDRAYVQIKGFIDPETQGFVRLEGEVLGNDGGAGLRGKRRRVSSPWGKVLDRVAQSGTQILTGILGRQGSSVIIASDPYGIYRSTSNSPSQDSRSFVEVTAGEVGFVLVTTLPDADKSDSYLADRAKESEPMGALTDAELAQLLAEADPAQIRAAMPRMNPELRRVAEMVLKEIESTGK